jgi:hypothetical protein
MSLLSSCLAMPGVCVTPCSEGYWPVSSDARLGAQAARHRIVMPERHPVLSQPLQTGQMLPPELGEFIGFIGRRVVLLIGEDEEDVRARSHATTLAHPPRQRLVQIG